MKRIANILFVLGVTLTAIVAALVFWSFAGLLVVMLVSAVVGWILFAFFHYRSIRQEEVLHLMTTAAEAQSPIGPALWAYLDDRSRGWGFDRKLERLAVALDSGMSLAAALRAAPGVASRETVLAASVGESMGRLALCLGKAPRWRFATVWVMVAPRLLYPFLVLMVVSALFTFHVIFIAPKFEKIFADFRLRLPDPTNRMYRFGRSFWGGGGGFVLAFFSTGLLAVLLFFSATARWYCPGLGRLFRMHVQGRVLSMLGVLLEANRTLPEAVAVLVESGYFTGVARRRLGALRGALEQGEPLAPSLYRFGLLPARMVALVQAAERIRNLPWALAELGGHLNQRTERLMHRVATVFFLVAVLGIGLLVGYIALALFLPLIKIMTELL